MRVSDNTNFEAVRDGIGRSKARMDHLQLQASTLKKVTQPSDDPVGVTKILELRTDKVNNDQYIMNSKIAETFLSNTDHALGELSEVVLRAKEIALSQASTPSSSEDSRAGISEEVGQLINQAVSIGNRRVGERYIFGGFKTQKPPVEEDGKYVGDDGQMMVEIGKDVFLSMNVPGNEVFNTHPKANNFLNFVGKFLGVSQPQEENVNVFDELQKFRIALLTGDEESIRDTLERFDQLHSKLVGTRAKLGSRLQGLQYTSQAIERHNLTNSGLSSFLEDADMAQVVSDLGKEESVFKSSLATSRKLIQPTLLEFLR